MKKKDIRWIQRLDNYCKALDGLKREVELASKKTLSDLEKKGVIKSFEYVHELSWNVLKDFLEFTGETRIMGSRDAFQLAFQRQMIVQGDHLMAGIKDRNLTVHAYNEETANKIFRNIVDKYYGAFEEIRSVLLQEKRERGM